MLMRRVPAATVSTHRLRRSRRTRKEGRVINSRRRSATPNGTGVEETTSRLSLVEVGRVSWSRPDRLEVERIG